MGVIVIGGGPAGLSAAYNLKKKGNSPLLLEMTDRVGGRMFSKKQDEFVIDIGTQFFTSYYKKTLTICKELGLENQFSVFNFSVGICRQGKIYPGISSISFLNRLFFLPLIARLLLNHKQFNLLNTERIIEKLDDQNVADFALQYFNQELLDYWFDPFVSAATSAMPEQVSISSILSYMRLNMAQLLTLKNGTGSLVDRLYEALDKVLLNAQVNRIIIENNEVKGIEFNLNGKPEILPASAVIVATPAPKAAKLLPDTLASAKNFLANIPYTACIHVIYVLEHKVLEKIYGIAVPSKLGTRLSILSEDTNKCSIYAPPGMGIMHAVTSDKGARILWNQSDEVIKEEIASEIRMILPTFPKNPIFSIVQRWPYNMCLISPGYTRKLAVFNLEVQQIKGLIFAGDYLTLPCLEGAVVSGMQAAELSW